MTENKYVKVRLSLIMSQKSQNENLWTLGN